MIASNLDRIEKIGSNLDGAMADGRIWNVHGVVILQDGQTVVERYYAGQDWRRGQPLGQVIFTADTQHDLRSVSKSIVGILYGLALAAGSVPPSEASLLVAFPEYTDLANDPARRKWTVHHALSMTMGTDWDELSVPYTDPTNSEIAMDTAPDRYRYVLERPIALDPGQRWIYCGGATALIARIIEKGTGQRLHDFARTSLFDPLGLGPTEWLADDKGDAFAASGLRMTPRDLARIGHLMLSLGQSDGRQLVPRPWIERITAPVVSADDLNRYGYQWYLGDVSYTVPAAPRWNRSRLLCSWKAMGNGGQRLFLFPESKLAVAITAGNYDGAEQWVPPGRILREIVLPALG